MVTTQSADSVLKSYYLDAVAQQLDLKTNPLLAAIERTTSDVWGKDVKKPVIFGVHGGVMGETCSLAILIGLAWLLITRTISPVIPVTYLATVAVLFAIAGEPVLANLLTGGLLFGAVFMATDYVTSPFTLWGKLVFGLGLGLITFAIRMWGSLPEGVSYAILFMNLLVPYINNLTRQVPLGGGKKHG